MRPMNQLERDLKSRPVWNCDAKSKSVAFTAEGFGPDDAGLEAVSAKMKGTPLPSTSQRTGAYIYYFAGG